MVGDEVPIRERPRDRPCQAHREIAKLHMNTVSFDDVVNELEVEFAVTGGADAHLLEEVKGEGPMGLDALGRRGISTVITILVTGMVQTRGDHFVSDVALDLGDADAVRALRA